MGAREQFYTVGLIILVWGTLVGMGKVPAPEFIATIRELIVGLGVYHATRATPSA